VIPDEFQRGLIYTVDPRILVPLASGEEYRIVASTRFLIGPNETFTAFESLYRRARRLIERRRQELTSASPESHVHTWIASHGWFRMEIGKGALVGAVVTLGAACAPPAADVPRGQDEPTHDALQSPYVAQLGGAGGPDKAWYDEFYNDFDMRQDRSQASVLTVSYGEYVPSPDDVDVDGVIARAEDRARSYLEVVGAADEQLRIAKRDWNCLETGKSAKPFLAYVDLLFSDSRHAQDQGPGTDHEPGTTKN
jgi:hypothetical protein